MTQSESSMNMQTVATTTPDSPTKSSQKKSTNADDDIRSWSKARVQKWFEEKDISELCSVLDFCDGKHLQTLYTRHSTSPEALQADFKSDLGLAFQIRLKFVTALEELFQQSE